MATKRFKVDDLEAQQLIKNLSDPLIQARASPAGFAILASQGKWELQPHLALLNRKLVKVARGEITRLMISMPPRHGKSEFTSKYFPAWYLGTHPENRVILTSYEDSFAASWGRKSRDLLEEFGPDVFGVSISQDSKAAFRWDIARHSGGMSTAGAGGAITGKGAHLAIIDDPVKNQEQANSRTSQEHNIEWYRSTLYTRLEGEKAAIILIMTRWSQGDLAGKLLEEMKDGGDKWEIVNMPAIAEEDEWHDYGGNKFLFRNKGEALWPAKFDEKKLADIKIAVGSYWWASLYQQRPSPLGGGMFVKKNFRYFRKEGDVFILETENDINPVKRVPKEKCRILQYIDTAATTSTKSDYTVIMTVAITPEKEILVTDLFRERVEASDHLEVMKRLYDSQHPSSVYIEDRTYGTVLIQTAKKVTGIPVRPLKAVTDKVTRAYPISARYETHSVYHLKGASWLNDFEEELANFPNGEHDDMVDALAYAGINLSTQAQVNIRLL